MKNLKAFNENFENGEPDHEEGLASKCCNAPITANTDLCSACGEHTGISSEVEENYQDEQTKQNFMVRWTDQEGYSYSVVADTFVNGEALVRALEKSSAVRKVESKKLGLG